MNNNVAFNKFVLSLVEITICAHLIKNRLYLTDVNDFHNYGCRVHAVIRDSFTLEALLEKLQAFGVLEVFLFIHFSDRFISVLRKNSNNH